MVGNWRAKSKPFTRVTSLFASAAMRKNAQPARRELHCVRLVTREKRHAAQGVEEPVAPDLEMVAAGPPTIWSSRWIEKCGTRRTVVNIGFPGDGSG